MVAEKPKNKEYFLKAYNSSDVYHACLAFRYDDLFFTDILETLISRDRSPSLSFPVENDFFKLFKWKTIGGLPKSGISFKELDDKKFIFTQKYTKKVEDKDKLQSARLHITENTFHFSAISFENISYNTEDFDEKFIHTIKKFHIERLLATV